MNFSLKDKARVVTGGSGTSNYSFIWGMGGENMEFTDMDGIAIKDIR